MAVYNGFATNKEDVSLARPTRSCRFQEDDNSLPASGIQCVSCNKLRCLITSPHFLYSTTIIILLGLYIFQLGARGNLRSYTPSTKINRTQTICGASQEEARSMGCVFDVYVNEWLPASCYDRAVAEVSESNLSDLYPAAAGRSTFPLFWDQAMVKRATVEEVMLAAFENIENGFQIEFYTAWEFHRAHCLHLWRLTVSALQQLDRGKRNVGVYYKSVSPEHAWHCNRFIVEGDTRDPDKITSIAPGVGKCVVLNSF
ncbi:hypothetical protein CDEST_11429 [Colletotrichum destructivum]|uniref:Uncharacterized protein n=1 Tax=Colletotrichum destructivum TaxID=34406 RepID=A0AAX4ITA4_9PEZI|nr:hypothetical protein CDEST_11429 [Colletotrichum destructivum]